MSNNLKTLINQSINIDKRFQKRWDILTRLVNLSEEVGELSHDILVEEKLKNDKQIAKSLGANLTNLLYEILMIADHYNVDMDKAWKTFLKEMPAWAKMRNKTQKIQ